ncbi:MAG: OB-fold nucleic acid binding domain-containing protein [Armatimonadetes bacterium]|nr:OB-fold nucleic acid binding domain-containing protein [Armatimonadota bacterium]MDW8122491.1 OB-fold nucleic acid binding domain-containing protein [Armatimonadota bacterium]
MAKGQYLVDLKAGDYVDTTVFVKAKTRYPYRNRPGYFLGLVLKDRSGAIEGRVWDNAEQVDREIEVKDVIRVRGIVEVFQQVPQIRIAFVEKLTEEQYDRTDLVAYTQKDPAQMLQRVRSAIESVANEHLKGILKAFFDDPDFVKSFSEAPATYASHHCWLGGLLEHTVALLDLSDAVLLQYPGIDRDLLIAGILLHDVGRVREFRWDIDWEPTDEGRLLGHLVLGDQMIREKLAAIADFPEELAMRLRHMVISHWGTGEWGTPRMPMTLEAAALSFLNRMDARMNRMEQLVKEAREGESPWTGYIRALRRRLYLGYGLPGGRAEGVVEGEEITPSPPTIELPLTEWDFLPPD